MIIETEENIIHILPDIVYKIDAKGFIQYVNDSVKILGYEPSELIGMHFSILIHPEDVSGVKRDSILKNSAVLKTRNIETKMFDERRTGERITRSLNIRLVPKNWGKIPDNKNIYSEIYSIGVYDDTDEKKRGFLGTIGIIRDITGLKDTEANLYKVKQYYKSLIENSSDIYSILAIDGAILSISPSIERITGIAQYDFIGENIINFIHPDDTGSIQRIFEMDELPEKGISLQVRINHMNSSLHYIEGNIKSIKNDQDEIMCFLLKARDITEIKKSHHSIQEQRENYYAILNQINDAYIEIDTSYNIGFFNREALKTLHCAKQDLKGKKLLDLLNEEGRIKANDALNKAISRKEHIEIYSLAHLNPDNTLIYLNISISPILDIEENVSGLWILLKDVTSRKHEEDELIKAKANAEKINRMKTEFLTNLSHEIRTPMNAIIGYTDLMLDDISIKKHWEYLNTIKDSGGLLLSIINDILDLSKIEAGTTKTELAPVSLENILKQVEQTSLILLKDKETDIKLTKSLSPDISRFIMSDPIRLQQVLYNLMYNAVKFTDKGHINFGCRPQDENTLLFFVEDTGIGIPPGYHEMIFESFKQVNNSMSKIRTGTGLGLTISKKLIKLMGGDIWVDSNTGNNPGSTFYFTLPYLPSDEMISQDRDKLRPVSSTDEMRILVAEDNIINQKLLKTILEKEGYIVEVTNNGFETIVRMNSEPDIDLILMDIQMPEMDGFQTTRKIREIEEKNGLADGIPIIAITAAAMKSERDLCISSGCDNYLSKPVDKTILLKMIEKYLAN